MSPSTRYHRQKIVLPAASKEDVLKLLETSTLFWNFLITHLRRTTERYLKQPVSAEEDKKLTEEFVRFFRDTVDRTEGVPHRARGIAENWGKYMPQFRQVSSSVLRNRMTDMVNAFIRAKQSIAKTLPGTPAIYGPPCRKSARSTKSVRFDKNDFSLRWHPSRKLVIVEIPAVNFRIPMTVPETLILEDVTAISISLRRIPSEDGLGPRDDDDREVLLTLWLDQADE